MSVLPSLFWLALLLPGFALARRLAPRELGGGPLPSIAVAFVASFAALALPIALGYLFGAPIGLVAIGLAAFIAWGAVDLVRTNALRSLGPALLAAIGVELAIIVADLVFSWRHGSLLAADARVHLARIRFLHDHGLSNLDPFVGGGHPYPIYHTNLLHALLAAGSRLLGIDPLEMWFASLAAAKLMIVSGLAYLAWAVLGSRWAAWTAAVMAVAARGPFTFSLYPNQLAPWFLLPVLVGVVARSLDDRDGGAFRGRGAVFLASGAVAAVIGMFHPMYAGFAAVLCGPTLVAFAAMRRLRKRPGADRAALALAGILALGLPFPLVSRALTVKEKAPVAAPSVATDPAGDAAPGVAPDETAAAEAAALAETALPPGPPPAPAARPPFTVEDGFTYRPAADPADALIFRTFGRSFTARALGGWMPAWRLWVLAIGAALAIALLRRPAAWLVVGAIATIETVLLVPDLCTLAVRSLGATWMVERFETLAFMLWIPLSAPAVAAAIEPRVRNRIGGIFARGAISLASIPLALVHASHRPPYDWNFYWSRVRQPESSRLDREYRPLLRVQALLREAIPAGSVTLVQPFVGTRLRMLHDLVLVASERSSNGVPNGRTRRAHVDEMLRVDTDEERRAELFRRYGVDRYVVREEPADWAAWWTDARRRGRGYTVLTLRDEPDADRLWIRELKLASRAARRGEHADAAARLEALLATRPDSDGAWFALGHARLALGEPAAAAEAYARAEALVATDPRHALMRGNALAAGGDHASAVEAFVLATNLALAEENRPFASTAHFNLGNSLYALDRVSEALAEYERALALDPTHAKARLARGWLREDLGLDPADGQSPSATGFPPADGTSAPSSNPTP